MAFAATIERVQTELNTVFDQLGSYFDLPDAIRQIHPAANEWSIDEILEHITLTDHFLMLTLRTSLRTVLKRSKAQAVEAGESDLDSIVRIGDPDAFGWIRPEHMEPTRLKPMREIRATMTAQRLECLMILDQLPNGEGSLHKVSMSVQSLGKLDMYQWLYFLVQHAKRHTVEIERILQRFAA
ncbi:MAG: DinB family protein [Chloroflexi bacterium]|nr:DinB family protein [Chloroflexota bacterium]MCC6894667.1 DinB family protein [Anaerolineae bacterium]